MTTIDPKEFLAPLLDAGVDFFAGVPDSVLKEFCWAVEAAVPAGRHIIAANEGGAVGLATGAYIADGKVPAVYLQNSGLGNAVNPLLSLADP
ncbi:thiamine pyrophosphate-binding protein, partial [Oceanibaculum nanhaiense]|uniref:thiamine pyrophosphate-binding protein n=1 Tax=Oceanibaculum nanhaiense TaxID=1909734 RepID=UPI00396E19EE